MVALIRICDTCHVEVLWLGELHTHRAAAIDVSPSADGNVEIDEGAGTYRVLNAQGVELARASGLPLHTRHDTTCTVLAAPWEETAP